MSEDGVEGLKVLVIDDQRTMRSIIRNLLKTCGYRDIDEAPNGTEALYFIQQNDRNIPDVIITDLHMDRMDGLELTNQLRLSKNDALRKIPVILLTGYEDELVHEVGEQVGACHVLIKPVAGHVLHDTIRKAVYSRNG